MSRIADIVPLASRRRPRQRLGEPLSMAVDPPRLEGSTENGAWIVLVALMGLLGAGAISAASERFFHRAGLELPPAERAAVFQRAYDDLRETCRLPEAAGGPLLDRCRSTASFVVLFPECDAACGQAARALQPRSRR
jgi:cytochrome b pre-mRNA-processing protein 3